MTQRNLSRPKGVRIASTGMAIPPRKLTNDDLARIVDTNDEWITQRVGIKQRHVADDDVTVRDLSRQALEQALERAAMQPTDLDLVLVATLTPETTCPSTAARVVAEIGAQPAGAMDLSAACSGFVYALNVASSLVESGQYRTIGVIGAETLSKVTDYTDRRTCILFGDGAGAAIVTAGDDPAQGCLHQIMHSEGDLWGELYLPRDASQLPEEHDGFTGQYDTLQMNGRTVYKFAVKTTLEVIEQTLDAADVKPEQLAMVVPHQSNRRILESARQRLGLPEDKLYVNIDRFGNTSAASVPICLHELHDAGRIHEGDLVLFMAIGGGMTWTTSLWRW